MNTIQFWKTWPLVYQRILLVFALLFLAALGFEIISLIQNPEPVFAWQQLQELQQQSLPVYTFETGGINFIVSTNNYIVFERWTPDIFRVNLRAGDFYLIFFALSLSMLLTIITVLKRFWFFIGSGMVIFVLASFQWEALEFLSDPGNKLPTAIVITLFIGLCLFYQYIRITASFLERLLAFSAALILTGVAVSTFSTLAQPLRFLAVNTLPASLTLVVIFIIMVAHEIIAGFVSLVGQASQKSKNLKNFLIISGVYLLNLWLAYLSRISVFDWDFTIHPVIVLAASSVLAIWGIRQRQPQYQNIIPSDPFAVYFILSLGTIAFAVTGYFLATANDIALLSINDLIIYAHIGYGMVFMTYVGSNFLELLRKNLPAHKVLYKPTTMPYFTYRLAGLIFTLAFVFYNTWTVPLNHFISGYYSSLADVYSSEGNSTLALGYYHQAHGLAPYNQHAATALAKLERERNNIPKEEIYLKDAIQFLPTEFTLLNYADAIHTSGSTVDEIIYLQDASKQLPKSSIIKNNLALGFERLGVIDSAYWYFSIARKDNRMQTTADMNLLGMLAINNLKVSPDSLIQLLNAKEDRVKGNALAIANQQKRVIGMSLELPKDSVLNLFNASLIGNFLTNHLENTDTTFLAGCIALAHKNGNEQFKELILASASNACYVKGQVNRAFQLLQELILEGTNPGKYYATIALWSLDQEMPDVRAVQLQSEAYRTTQSSMVAAVTLAEAGRINEAIIAWDTLVHGTDTLLQSVAESMKRVLGGPDSWYGDFTDKEKYQFLRYRVPLPDSSRFEKMIIQITDEDLRAKALFDRSKKWYMQDQVRLAARTYQKLQGLHLTDMKLFADIKYYELRLFAAQGQWAVLQEQIQKGILFGSYREAEHVFTAALTQAASGDMVKAETNFKWLAYANSFFDEGIVVSAAFFQKNETGKYSSYTILSEALQVNRNSVRILKAYIPTALAKGFEQYAISALQTLQSLIPKDDFRRFVNQNHLEGLPLQ